MEKFDRGTSSLAGRVLGPLAARRTKWWVVLVALVLSGLALASGATALTSNDPTANLPDGAESTRAAQLAQRLPSSEVSPALVVFDRRGKSLTEQDRAAVSSKVEQLSRYALPGQRTVPVFADDGQAAFVVVPLSSKAGDAKLRTAVENIRTDASKGLPGGLRAQVTGGPAFRVDLTKVFDGANVTLLVTTASVVALLLLITYRSPWLWLVPLAVVGTADQVASKAVAGATHLFGFTVDGSTTGITSVLVFGAGTNYALLLIARFREELRKVEDRHSAMRKALSEAAPAILASSSTVVLALLALSFAQTPSNRALGYAGAIGIVTAVVYALLVLPAALLLFGRGLFWPFVPRVGQQEPTRTGIWAKVGRTVTRRPAPVIAVTVVLLAVLALPLTGLTTGLSQTEQFRAAPESVQGQKVLAAHFPAGSSEPTTVLTSPDKQEAVLRAARGVDGVSMVRPSSQKGDLAGLQVTLTGAPASGTAFDQVRALRDAVHQVDPGALVGGSDAQALDAKDAAVRDQQVIIPLILGIVVVILLLLLRSVVAAVLLVLTVVATYVASLGASWFAFDHWFGFPALDLGVPLLSFLFLVALGVDYNIFLSTRAKEEAEQHDTRTAISTALAVTGGVITSAGILLAAVFTVLGVLPLITLTQIGIIVGFGVLLDTLLVRSVLVPAIVAALGRRFWWPGRLSRRQPAGAEAPETVGAGAR